MDESTVEVKLTEEDIPGAKLEQPMEYTTQMVAIMSWYLCLFFLEETTLRQVNITCMKTQ